MGQSVRTNSNSRVTVFGWKPGANRSIAPGPGQRYETVDVQYCAGPGVQDKTSNIVPLFSLNLPNGGRVAPDTMSASGEFGSKGTVNPGQCARGPLVFQVAGGAKPASVSFETRPETKWTVS